MFIQTVDKQGFLDSENDSRSQNTQDNLGSERSWADSLQLMCDCVPCILLCCNHTNSPLRLDRLKANDTVYGRPEGGSATRLTAQDRSPLQLSTGGPEVRRTG